MKTNQAAPPTDETVPPEEAFPPFVFICVHSWLTRARSPAPIGNETKGSQCRDGNSGPEMQVNHLARGELRSKNCVQRLEFIGKNGLLARSYERQITRTDLPVEQFARGRDVGDAQKVEQGRRVGHGGEIEQFANSVCFLK